MAKQKLEIPSAFADSVNAAMTEMRARWQSTGSVSADAPNAEIATEHGRHVRSPFVQDLIETVHGVTGQTFGTTIYQRLIKEHFPGRAPNAQTIARYVRAYTTAKAAALTTPFGNSLIGAPSIDALADALAEKLGLTAGQRSTGPDQHVYHELALVRSRCDSLLDLVERLTAENAVHKSEKAALLQMADKLHASAVEQATAIGKLAEQVEANRKHSLMFLDQAGGRARSIQESLDAEKARNAKLTLQTEFLRQAAYRNGSPLPPEKIL